MFGFIDYKLYIVYKCSKYDRYIGDNVEHHTLVSFSSSLLPSGFADLQKFYGVCVDVPMSKTSPRAMLSSISTDVQAHYSSLFTLTAMKTTVSKSRIQAIGLIKSIYLSLSCLSTCYKSLNARLVRVSKLRSVLIYHFFRIR